ADRGAARAEDDCLEVFVHPQIIVLRSRVFEECPRMSASPRLIFSVLFVLFIASTAAAQPKRAMTGDDVIDLVQLSAPRISPDGRRVLYTQSELGKWKDNKRVTSIWIAGTDGSNAR